MDVDDPNHDRCLDDTHDHWRMKRVSVDDGWDWHDGAGYYLILDEYPEEGSVGAFKTSDDAIAWIRASEGAAVLVGKYARAS